MEETLKNKLGFWVFVIIVLTLGIGGYFFTSYTLKSETKEKEHNEPQEISYKINEEEDYIYFVNGEVISEKAEIYYQDVVINLNTQEVLNKALEKENTIYKSNIKYLSDMDIVDEIINYNIDNLYALTFREYEKYQYEEYVSLVVNDYNYSCFDERTFNNTKGYVFNIKNGELINEEDLLKMYGISLDDIKEKIRENLLSKQSVVDGQDLIKIDETVNELNNYALYINDYGKLNISYLVKTTQVDYNEDMEVK